MIKKVYGVLCVITLILVAVQPASSRSLLEYFNKSKEKESLDIYDLSIDDNLSVPELGKYAEAIAAFQQKQALLLQKNNHLDVATVREGEVIVVTISASQLFAPNAVTLSELGKIQLKPLLKFLKTPGVYKMILAMHSDNTGNDIYTLNMTKDRVNAVYDWIGEGDESKLDYVVPYALGGSEPEYPNNSVENRKKNRRLEIYLVPESAMVEMAKKGVINL